MRRVREGRTTILGAKESGEEEGKDKRGVGEGASTCDGANGRKMGRQDTYKDSREGENFI